MASADSRPAGTTAATRNAADRKSNAGTTPDPWEMCAKLEYGADRSFAWAVQQQVVQTPPEGRARLEERLLKSLAQPNCTEAGRAFLCRMLAMVGSAKSVPPLAALLRDVRTTEAARYALEPIPGPEVDAALRDALGALTGPAKAGLIGSIARRRDAAARGALVAIKDNAAEPPLVRQAATRALECIGSTQA